MVGTRLSRRVWARCAIAIAVTSALCSVVLISPLAVVPASATGGGAVCLPNCTPPLVNNGGSVEKNPRVVLIFWGPLWTSDATHRAVRSAVVSLFSGLAGTPYNELLSQYGVNDDIALVGDWLDSSTPPATLSALGNVDEIAFELDQHKGSVKDADTSFFVFTQKGTKESGFVWDLGAICGYHSALPTVEYPAYGTIVYGATPWPATQTSSSDSCGGNDVEAETTTASHEYAEIATDPGNSVLPGWTTSDWRIAHDQIYEVGDLCNDSSYLSQPPVAVQELWDNRAPNTASGACELAADTPRPTPSPRHLDFGGVPIGTTSGPLTVSFTNTGLDPLKLDTYNTPVPFKLGQAAPACLDLASGATCTVSYTFSPSAPGPVTRVATIDSYDLSHPGDGFLRTKVTLRGYGTSPPANATVVPAALRFGDQTIGTGSDYQYSTITNIGTSTLLLQSAGFVSQNTSTPQFFVSSSAFRSKNCLSGGARLSPGALYACNLYVYFRPTLSGPASATYAITYRDLGASPPNDLVQVSIQLSGYGTPPTTVPEGSDPLLALVAAGVLAGAVVVERRRRSGGIGAARRA